MIHFYRCLRAAGWQRRNALVWTWHVYAQRNFGPIVRWLDQRARARRNMVLR